MKGTEKQVNWAVDIRTKKLEQAAAIVDNYKEKSVRGEKWEKIYQEKLHAFKLFEFETNKNDFPAIALIQGKDISIEDILYSIITNINKKTVREAVVGSVMKFN